MTMASPTCEYCGRCLSVCPSYKHYLVETMGPRARIDLAHAVERGDLVPGERYAQSLKSCLQCLACTEICGKGVDGAQIILNARLAQKDKGWHFKRSLEKAFTTRFLTNRSLLKRSMTALALLQKIFPKEREGSVRHLPDALSGFLGKRSLPVIAGKSLDELLPEHNIPKGIPVAGEAVLFAGCFGSLVSTTASLRLVATLNRLGITVHIPKGQSCCGAPAQLSGFEAAFSKAQEHNAKVFAPYKGLPVLTQCATCFRTLSQEYAEAGKDIADSVLDASVFLHQHYSRDFEKAPGNVHALRPSHAVSPDDPLVVAVHDPCHLRLNPEAGSSLRACLDSLPWIQLTELSEKGICCGGGGVSSLKNPKLADELGQYRAETIMKSQADIVVSQCPGCVLQLNNHLSRLSARQRAVHALELIAV